MGSGTPVPTVNVLSIKLDGIAPFISPVLSESHRRPDGHTPAHPALPGLRGRWDAGGARDEMDASRDRRGHADRAEPARGGQPAEACS